MTEPHETHNQLPVKEDLFWYNDSSILYNRDRLLEFVPTKDMSTVEKLNAISRMAIYSSILSIIIYQNISFLFIGIIGMSISYFLYKNEVSLTERYTDSDDRDDRDDRLGHQPVSVDGNGNPYHTSTTDNPFMNVLLTDYVDNPTRLPAGNLEDPAVKAIVEKNYNFGLYKNADDIWDRNNSQRQYVSNPGTTIPNDRHTFMHWCWNIPYSCKDGDMLACLDVDGPRRHGQII